MKNIPSPNRIGPAGPWSQVFRKTARRFGIARIMVAHISCLLSFNDLALGQATEKAPPPKAAATMDSILLKDYQPDSSLVVPITHLPKARFKVIDVHSHPYVTTPAQIADWVKAMDEAGVELTVVLTGKTGPAFDHLVDLYLKPYPNRFQLFCGLNASNSESPDFPEKAVAELVRCYEKGARGVGELMDKGPGLAREFENVPSQRLHPDDPRLDLFWEKCAELKLPVSLHMADHPSAWRPLDAHQERLPRYERYNQVGKGVPSYEELLTLRDRTLARHLKTIFFCCHLGNEGNDLTALGRLLDTYPNLYVDIAARDYELGRQPKFAAKFLARYHSRVLFGTDEGVGTASMYEAWWRLLESDDEYMPGSNWWRLYGLALPDSALKSIYRDNALKLLNWAKPQ